MQCNGIGAAGSQGRNCAVLRLRGEIPSVHAFQAVIDPSATITL
jgi:hypothetical protein